MGILYNNIKKIDTVINGKKIFKPKQKLEIFFWDNNKPRLVVYKKISLYIRTY